METSSKVRLMVGACIAVSGMGFCAWAQAACSGPAELEARLRAHPSAEGYAELGQWFDAHHSPACAAEAYQPAVKIEPGSAALEFALGKNLYFAGRAAEAIAPLARSAQLEPGQISTHLLLGAALGRMGRGNEAEAQWEAALKLDPSSKPALDGQAKYRIAAGDFDSVIRSLRAVERDENLNLDLANAYRDEGRMDEAAQVLREGLKTLPDSVALTAALVSLEVHESHFEEATRLSEGIAQRKPDDLNAQRIYFRTLVITGNNDVAARVGRRLLEMAPRDADLLNLNGLLEQRAGDFAAARRDLELAVEIHPNDLNARVNLGVTLAELKDPAGAKVQLEKALALGADEPQVHFELAKALRALGDTQQAQEQLAIYQKRLKQEADQALAASKAAEAEEALKAGDRQRAASLYREASAAQPENAALAYQLATVLGNAGDADGERAALEQALKADPTFVQAQYQLGYMDFQAGDNTGAERHFRLTVEQVPDNAQAWVSLAATLGAESRVDEARVAVAKALQLEPDNASAQELRRKLATQDPH